MSSNFCESSACFKELHGYSLREVKDRLQCSEENALKFLNRLRQHGIVKAVRKENKDFSEITNEDVLFVENADDADGVYKFDFVGTVVVGIQVAENKGLEKVFFCYPKYITESPEKSLNECRNELKLVIRAIQKYDSKRELVHLYNGGDKGSFNRLALSLYILNDYYENDVYSNVEQIIETNGDGEVDWERTINESFTYLKKNRPYYLELKTISVQNDELDFFKRLHECIVTECSSYLENLGLLDLFGLNPVQLNDSKLEDLGDKNYIGYRIERELSSQFMTRKQNLLKTLYTYIAEKNTEQQYDSFSVYGTNSLNLVWEKACGSIFKNHYENGKYNDGEISFEIEKPKWHFYDNVFETETLIPDILTRFTKQDGKNVYGILDGKYYLIENKNGSICGNPGIQDVVKQFVYHKSILRKIEPNAKVFNSFLFPRKVDSGETDVPFIDIFGYITLMDWGMEELVPVYLTYLDPTIVWESYVNSVNKKNELDEAQRAADKHLFYDK